MGELKYKPTGYSYRVDKNVWAGEYPIWEWEQGARMRQLKLFTDFGINYFLDLTEDGEMPVYAPFLTNISTLRECQQMMLLQKCVTGLSRTGALPGCLRPKPKHR